MLFEKLRNWNCFGIDGTENGNDFSWFRVSKEEGIFSLFPIFCVYSMAIKTSRIVPERSGRLVFDRLGGGRGGPLNSINICRFWLNGRCLKNPCRFAHCETPDVPTNHVQDRPQNSHYYRSSRNVLVSNSWQRASQDVEERVVPKSVPRKSSDSENISKKLRKNAPENDLNLEDVVEENSDVPKKTPERVCEFWVQGNCVNGDQCHYLHSRFRGDQFTMLAELQGHIKVAVYAWWT